MSFILLICWKSFTILRFTVEALSLKLSCTFWIFLTTMEIIKTKEITILRKNPAQVGFQ